MYNVTAIEAFTDNYIWCLHNSETAWVVDPGDATPVLTFLQSQHLQLHGILITHHHHDHIGGVKTLLSEYPAIPVIGPDTTRIPCLTRKVKEGDEVTIPAFDCQFDVLEVPAHTLDHIAYYGDQRLFCGDTLFSAGCGRLFEGTPAQMLRNLRRFAELPGETSVYCAHEYTQANNRFALAIKPDDSAFLTHQREIEALRSSGLATVPTTIAKEKAVNPFMRADDPGIAEAIARHCGSNPASETEVFREMRLWKDSF